MLDGAEALLARVAQRLRMTEQTRTLIADSHQSEAALAEADLVETLQSHLDLMQRELNAVKARQAAEQQQQQQQQQQRHQKTEEKYMAELEKIRVANEKMAAALAGLRGDYAQMAADMARLANKEAKLVQDFKEMKAHITHRDEELEAEARLKDQIRVHAALGAHAWPPQPQASLASQSPPREASSHVSIGNAQLPQPQSHL